MSAMTTEKPINPGSSRREHVSFCFMLTIRRAVFTGGGRALIAASVVLAVKLGSRKCSMVLPPPSAAEMPMNPATIAPIASACSGKVIGVAVRARATDRGRGRRRDRHAPAGACASCA